MVRQVTAKHASDAMLSRATSGTANSTSGTPQGFFSDIRPDRHLPTAERASRYWRRDQVGSIGVLRPKRLSIPSAASRHSPSHMRRPGSSTPVGSPVTASRPAERAGPQGSPNRKLSRQHRPAHLRCRCDIFGRGDIETDLEGPADALVRAWRANGLQAPAADSSRLG